ncbi:hypothetical protein MLD38_028861 [Melastoma candidum]|uniref:Uncharacterized protein n=1 Tax=Melastoma candidum TaxID=119954 RepID=A0ACB9N275_9MYRT|nr:hypothetical protein MLD38_028861 [Melastoma candidum]
MNDLLSDSFEIPRGQPSRDGDIELGAPPMNTGDDGLQNFLNKVRDIKKQVEKVNNVLRKLQDAQEESKSVTKAAAMKVPLCNMLQCELKLFTCSLCLVYSADVQWALECGNV